MVSHGEETESECTLEMSYCASDVLLLQKYTFQWFDKLIFGPVRLLGNSQKITRAHE